MKPESQTLVSRVIDTMVQAVTDERQLGTLLKNSSATERREIACYLEDMINRHPNLPEGASTSIAMVEKFIAHRVKIADLLARHEELELEWDALYQGLGDGDEILNW